MRVLWMPTVSPLPLTDGNRHRHFYLLREMSQRHEIVLVCPADAAEREALRALADLGVEVRPVSGSRRFRGRVVSGVRREPACLVPPEIDALAAAAADVNGYDVAFGALSVAPAVMGAPARRLVLDDQNVEAELYDRLWRAESWRPRKLARLMDWRAVRRFERRWLRAPDAVTACSRRDIDRLGRKARGQRFYVVPNGVDLAIEYRPDARETDTIVFIGGLSWAPNVDAVRTLALEIMPAVWRQRPGARLWLVGKDPTPEVRSLAGPQVTVTGAVASVAPYLRRASVTVIPLRSGGGTRLKILEAMAAGLPVVTTSVGAEGLDLASGVEAVVSDSRPELASATVELLGDPERAIGLAAAGRARVEADYGWNAIGRRLAVALSGGD